jgi:HAD superfamily hydrolase (TIGR01493 family)
MMCKLHPRDIVGNLSIADCRESIVLANGTARLQIDVTKSAGLDFDMLLSSELLGLTKPDPAIYRKAIELLGHKPEECLMVAAHAYDLEAAKKVYVQVSSKARQLPGLLKWN